VEHFCVKFGDPSCSGFEMSCGGDDCCRCGVLRVDTYMCQSVDSRTVSG